MYLFLAELNGMEAYTTDIGNAYLEAYTTEKLYVHAGSEFGDQECHLLIVKDESNIFISPSIDLRNDKL